jgi:5,5'-dehydrodivanillate O-demethylase
MLTEQENERLSRVGPGTPMGNLLRRYWQPIAALPELEREHVLPVRRLGEDLVLFKTRTGQLGLIQQRCAHRAVSLAYGIPTDDGLRCEYHGWVYSPEGKCLEQPFEEMEHQNANFKDKITVTNYPVETLGGLVFAYMGPPERKPLLPRWETFAREGVNRTVQVTDLPCNWLQCMENSMDPVHFEWLHANLDNWIKEKQGLPATRFPARHQKIDFDIFEYGIYKRRLLLGDDPETSADWLIGHPIIFPNYLAQGGGGDQPHTFQIRVPVDDYNTWHLAYSARPAKEGEEPTLNFRGLPCMDKDGQIIVDTTLQQDMMAWITQGWYGAANGISPRQLEHLGVSDRGIILYRQLLSDAIELVERGEDPPGLIYDEDKVEPRIRGEVEMGGPNQRFRLAVPAVQA